MRTPERSAAAEQLWSQFQQQNAAARTAREHASALFDAYRTASAQANQAWDASRVTYDQYWAALSPSRPPAE